MNQPLKPLKSNKRMVKVIRRRHIVPMTIRDCLKRQQGRDVNLTFRHK